MKKVLLSLAAVAAAAAALPAAAQDYGRYGPDHRAPDHGGYDQGYDHRGYDRRYDRGDYDSRHWSPIEFRLERLHQRIQRGVQSGRLTRREAQGLRMEFRDLVQRERVYSRDGLTWWERADLEARFERLSARIRFERRDGEDRGDRRHDRWAY